MLYWDVMRFVIAYDSETRVVKENSKGKLLLNERKIFRRILGPKRIEMAHGELKQNMN
jgi:hypothetical protein